MQLNDFFKKYPRVALGLSGGVDSAYLLYAAVHAGADVKAFFVKGPFQPEFELRDARRVADEVGVGLTVLERDQLSDPRIAENPADRCYYCKLGTFELIGAEAEKAGCQVIIDGTNASDDEDDRPGTRALKGLGVLSPLREAGLTKDMIRKLSKDAGLFTWDKPSYACLATRIPTGVPIERGMLSRVEGAEAALAELGFSDLRVRVWQGAARIQLPEAQMADAIAGRAEIVRAVKPYFDVITLDLEGR